MEPDNKIIYSEPVREIMGTPPRKLIAWGTTILFVIFLLMVFAAWFIAYPDIVPTKIVITSSRPPAQMTARTSGRLVFLKPAGENRCSEGELLAVIESSANFNSILTLEAFLSPELANTPIPPGNLPALSTLGEVQKSYSIFTQAYARLYHYKDNDYLGQRIRAMDAEIKAGKQYLASLGNKEKLVRNDLELEYMRFKRDSALKSSGFIAETDYETSYQLLLSRMIGIQQMELDILAESITVSRKEQELQELCIKKEEEQQELVASLSGTINDLAAAIDNWKNSYLMISPFNGTLNLSRFWSSDQYVAEGETVLTVVPDNQGELIGRAFLGMRKSGKVKEGMKVNIKLEGYPYLEYGLVKGVVGNISAVAENETYIAEVFLPSGLKTVYNNDIPFTQNMSGLAEIMTDDLPLIRKITGPLRYLITRNRAIRDSYFPE